MTDAKGILDQRLARGEISEEEFDRLVTKLSLSSTRTGSLEHQSKEPVSAAAAVQEIAKVGKSFGSWIGKVGIGILILLAVIGYLNSQKTSNLVLGGLETSGDRVKFKISNNGSKTGDVVAWVMQDDIESCNHSFTVKAGFTHTVTMFCPQLKDGKFTVHHAWASKDRDRFAISTRID